MGCTHIPLSGFVNGHVVTRQHQIEATSERVRHLKKDGPWPTRFSSTSLDSVPPRAPKSGDEASVRHVMSPGLLTSSPADTALSAPITCRLPGSSTENSSLLESSVEDVSNKNRSDLSDLFLFCLKFFACLYRFWNDIGASLCDSFRYLVNKEECPLSLCHIS